MKQLFYYKNQVEEKNKHKTKQAYTIGNLRTDINILPVNFVNFYTHIKFLINIANAKLLIPNIILLVNNLRLNFDFLVFPGRIIATPNQPAPRLIKQSAIVLITIFSIFRSYHKSQQKIPLRGLFVMPVINYDVDRD